MSNSNSNCDSPAVTTPSSAQKHHSRNTRKKRSRTTTKMNTVIDHNIAFKPKYAKQANPDVPMITRPCTECGKKFWSWKALFGHMRCHPERQWRGINPPPNFQRQLPPEKQIPGFMTQEDHEIAAGLLLLANGDPCSSSHQEYSEGDGLNGRFECSSCKKLFGSHQALGGHRASHKNVKGCFANAMTNDEEDDESDEMVMVLEGHKCSICLRVFSSGQALGGHMRCHWDKGEPEPEPSITHHHALITKQGCGLDLNLPAPLQHDSSTPLTLDLRLGL